MSVSAPELLCLFSAAFLATIGAVHDLRTRRIPNSLTLPGFVFGLLLHLLLGGWRQLGSALWAGIVCGLVFLAFYLAGGMGGGDVKLMAAAGCIAGLPSVANLLILTALAGGVQALGVAVSKRSVKRTFLNLRALACHHAAQGLAPHPELHTGNTRTLRMPYGLAIAAGSVLNLCLALAQR